MEVKVIINSGGSEDEVLKRQNTDRLTQRPSHVCLKEIQQKKGEKIHPFTVTAQSSAQKKRDNHAVVVQTIPN